jgi:3-oxoisoapionate kinase
MLYTFYGDDFTGSTDVLEQLALGGVRAALFLQPPTPDDLRLIPNLQAMGIAGDSRSQSPAWMSTYLPAIFQHLRTFNAPITHYKVCSTFDSSPTHGSIGRALETGLEIFQTPPVPIVIGAPHLRRFVSEGRLFAADPDGNIQRIDRHPMSRHPTTPMREPSLRVHLTAQTNLPIAEIHHQHLHEPLQISPAKAIIFDTITLSDLELISRNILFRATAIHPVFAIGSSGLTNALITTWRNQNLIEAPPQSTPSPTGNPASPLLVISGSCSPATARQITWTLNHGFHGVPIDPIQLLDTTNTAYNDAIVAEALKSLSSNTSTILYTATGTYTNTIPGAILGAALGRLLRRILERSNIHRILLCGGDTSSHAIQQLDLRALTWIRSLEPGAPLCKAWLRSGDANLQVVLKGGQVGTESFFSLVQNA